MHRTSTTLLASTIGFGLLYLAASIALGTPPDAGASGHVVAAWFRTHADHVRTWAWCLTLFVPVFATYAAIVRTHLPTPHRDVFFFGALAFVVPTAVQSWVWLGLSWHADGLSPPTAHTLLDVASYWGPVLNGATVTMLAPVVALGLMRSAIPTWLGAICGVALVEQLAETITIFGRSGFIAPGGPMNAELGAGLVALALLSLGIALARGARVGGLQA